MMNLFTKKCACGEMIFGPRVGGKARGKWVGYDTCTDCRAKALVERVTAQMLVAGRKAIGEAAQNLRDGDLAEMFFAMSDAALQSTDHSASQAQTIAALRSALEDWDRQASCWLGTRENHARPGWMQPAIDKGQAALSHTGEWMRDDRWSPVACQRPGCPMAAPQWSGWCEKHRQPQGDKHNAR